MRDYGTISPQFWLGKTGTLLRGQPEAQMVALYLMTSPHATSLGIFHCPLLYIAHETGMPFEGASKGLLSLINAGFCQFDAQTEEVFVLTMAQYQLGDRLAPKDKRGIWLKKALEKVGSAALRRAFEDIYSVAYNLPKTAANKVTNTSPFEAPSKPLRSQEQEQEQEQEGETHAQAPPPEPGPPSAAPHPPRFAIESQDFCKAERPDLDAATTWANFQDHYPPPKQTTANWRKWVRREQHGAPGGAGPGPPALSDPDSKASVEAEGMAQGIGRWDEMFEPWQAYKTRVNTPNPQAREAQPCH